MNWKKFQIVVLGLLLTANLALAETTELEPILAPVNKVAELVKAVVNVVAGLAITIAGAMYLFSGNNLQARENAKSMLMYAVVGLIIINLAPALAGYLKPAA